IVSIALFQNIISHLLFAAWKDRAANGARHQVVVLPAGVPPPSILNYHVGGRCGKGLSICGMVDRDTPASSPGRCPQPSTPGGDVVEAAAGGSVPLMSALYYLNILEIRCINH
ncbi:MAG: hypothetical protein WCY70_08530, partial [Methanoculleus sp.]